MVLLAGLLLDAFEVVDRTLARVVEQAHLEVRRQLDREDAEVALVVEDHGGVPSGSGRFLVRREQRVLERSDESPTLDALLALDLAYGVNDLLAHPLLPFIDQVGPHDLLVRDVHRFAVGGDLHRTFPGGDDLAACTAGLGLDAHRAADGADEMVTCAKRSFESRRGDLDGVCVEIGAEHGCRR